MSERHAVTARRGFTLIELMVVVLIISIMLMSVVPALDSAVPAYRLKGAAREVASAIELAQSESVSTRKRYELAYDLDSDTYWLVLPPRPRDEQAEEPTPEEAAAAAAARPEDDVEHGLPPRDPDAPQEEAEATTDAEREAIMVRGMPPDVVFIGVVVGGDDRTAGQVRVPFSHLGTDGSHIVGLKLENGAEADQLWIKFNAITRTIEYHDQRPEAKTVSGGGQ